MVLRNFRGRFYLAIGSEIVGPWGRSLGIWHPAPGSIVAESALRIAHAVGAGLLLAVSVTIVYVD